MKKKTFFQVSFCSIAVLIVFVVILSICTSSCRKQCFVSVPDTRGLCEDSPVIWYDNNAYVGKVSKIKARDGLYYVYIDFHKDYEKTIRAGVRACPITEKSISARPILMLVGGTDTSLPALSPGSQIPEMSLSEFQKAKALNFWSWFGDAKMGGTTVVLIILLIIAGILTLKVVTKVVKFGLVIAIFAILTAFFGKVSDDWNSYKEQFSSVAGIDVESLEDWVKTHFEQLKSQIPNAMQYFNDSDVTSLSAGIGSQNNNNTSNDTTEDK